MSPKIIEAMKKQALKKFAKKAEKDFPDFQGPASLTYVLVRGEDSIYSGTGEGRLEHSNGIAVVTLKPEHIKNLKSMIPFSEKRYAPKVVQNLTLCLNFVTFKISFYLIFTDNTDKLIIF